MKQTPTYPFQTAEEEVKESLGTKDIPEYPLAFLDTEFLLRKELRHIRLLLEYLKAEMKQQEQGIESTVVIFGSSKILPPEASQELLGKAQALIAKNPNDKNAQKLLRQAEHQVKKTTYYEEARRLAQIISANCQVNRHHDFVIVTGGGPGIMEAANRGAAEAKGKSIGLNIFLTTDECSNPYITPALNFQFHYFAIRKMHFLIRARALVFFPGGYGTLDELFEVLTLMQTKKIKPIPVLLFNKAYWSKMINFDGLVEEGAIDPEDIKFFSYVESAEESWEKITEFYRVDPNTCGPIDA